MPEGTFSHPLFGVISFRTNSSTWIRGDDIKFISGFDEADITPLVIPQLASVPGANGGHLRFHKRGHAQLLKAFDDIQKASLLGVIKSCAGTAVIRLRKPIGGGLSKFPSNHAFGTAIDLNSDDHHDGASTAPIASIFQANGFKWGQEFDHPDPMHYEIAQFLDDSTAAAIDKNAFIACRQKVANRGRPPLAFLDELVAWGKTADPMIFAKNPVYDIYSSVVGQLGPWQGDLHRKAAMLEVLRVLGGFESSWDWNAGRDVTNPNSNTPCTEEAGIFQCSGDSMSLGALKQVLIDAGGDGSCQSFIEKTKSNHPFAMEYCARLLRVTTKHHGPIKSGLIDPWLRRDAVDEFATHL